MRYKFLKGSKVEVLKKRDVPSCSWWCAEILSGNGHTYYVKYDRCTSDMGATVERVPKKAIRPCPPLVESPRSWVTGDVVEVFDNSSWKLAKVSMVVGGGCYFVSLIGSRREFRAYVSQLRLRQSWKDGKWVLIGKDSEKSIDEMLNRLPNEGNFSHQMLQSYGEVKKHPAGSHFAIGNGRSFKEFPRNFSRGMKKRPRVEACTGAGKKMRAVEKEGKFQRLAAAHAPRLHEKVHAVASPRTTLGEKCMHASLNNRTTGFCEADVGRKTPNGDDLYLFVPNLEPRDTESTSSSVGSCSTCNSPCRLIHPINGLDEDLGGDSDYAEPFSGPGSEPSPPTKEVLAAEIHRLELHAYRTTLVALHASGPISWEQEALITNLRLMLNISTDEYLLELRKLVLVENNASFR